MVTVAEARSTLYYFFPLNVISGGDGLGRPKTLGTIIFDKQLDSDQPCERRE